MTVKNTENVIKITHDTRTTGDGMAACLGLTRQRIVQLANDGVLERDAGSKYNVSDNIKKYLAFKSNNKGEASYDTERMLHEKAKRELAELALAKRKKEVHSTVDIEIMVGGLITVFKRRMLGIPHKMANSIAGKTADDISELLTGEIHMALTELAAFDISRLGEQVDDDDSEDS